MYAHVLLDSSICTLSVQHGIEPYSGSELFSSPELKGTICRVVGVQELIYYNCISMCLEVPRQI